MSALLDELRQEAGRSFVHDAPEVEELFYEVHPNGVALYAGPRTTHPRVPHLNNNLKLATFAWDREQFVKWIVEAFNASKR